MPRSLPPALLRHVAALPILLGALPLRAELKWDALEVSTKIHADQAEAVVPFSFVNAGTQPVTITAIRPGCGCTVPALAKNTYAPGERGEIRLTYHPGNREGLHKVDVEVTADDASSTKLMLVADIETLVSFDTRYVYWKGPETRAAKHIRLTFAAGQLATLTEAHSSDTRFAIKFSPVGDTGRDYDIEVTPPAEALNYTVITLRTQVGAEKTVREFNVVARTM